jgi:hypothetical protein
MGTSQEGSLDERGFSIVEGACKVNGDEGKKEGEGGLMQASTRSDDGTRRRLSLTLTCGIFQAA